VRELFDLHTGHTEEIALDVVPLKSGEGSGE
jgi:hypothetical protein